MNTISSIHLVTPYGSILTRNTTPLMDLPEVRDTSQSLFRAIKSTCVEITELTLLPDEKLHSNISNINYGLRSLTTKLQQHKSASSLKHYVLSSKVADYIFFPISNLLKQLHLESETIRYILEVVTFLTDNAWQYNLDIRLVDQLCPLVVVLAGGASISNSKHSTIIDKDFAFKSSTVHCLASLTHCFPRQYFQDEKNAFLRLSVLGDSTTILLDVMGSLGSTLNQDDNELVMLILSTLESLYFVRVTAEQTSLVFPGIISNLVNFCTTSKNIHTSTTIKVLNVLKTFIVKVLNDGDLHPVISDETAVAESLQSLKDLYENQHDDSQVALIPIKISLPEQFTKPHRTEKWIQTTSKKLNISMIALFRSLFFLSSSRIKISTKPQLRDAILEFVEEIMSKCFKSTFNELEKSSLDILSALIYVCTMESADSDADIDELIIKSGRIYERLSYSNFNFFLRQLQTKTENLISQFASVLNSTNDEKINICIVAIRLHFYVLSLTISLLNKDMESMTILQQKVIEIVTNSIIQNLSSSRKNPIQTGKDIRKLISGENSSAEQRNVLDNIELPPHIDAKNLTKINTRALTPVQGPNLRKLNMEYDAAEFQERMTWFGNIMTTSSENHIKNLLKSIANSNPKTVDSIQSILLNDLQGLEITQDMLMRQSIHLWVSNRLYQNMDTENKDGFDVNSFLQFELTTKDASCTSDELPYLLLEKAENLLVDAKNQAIEDISHVGINGYHSRDLAYASALETIGILTSHLSKDDFQTDVLMDWLFPILEALTFPNLSAAHIQAKICLDQIVQRFYGGSLETLISENSDYLIDSLSMSLSVASGLTPSLPGILLLVLKVSGRDLLERNQLQDILSEMFIVIDSFHGYSTLVENFFIVFEEVIRKIKSMYFTDISKSLEQKIESTYKPWGLTDRDSMLQLIDDIHRKVDPFSDYDPNKEYFKRKPGIPFGEQDDSGEEKDSDDEDSDDEDATSPEGEADSEVWTSPIPKGVYSSLQQIFTYGLQLLSHPSTKLKVQVLKTLKEGYPLMASNYKALMPLLAQYWPLILLILAGTTTISAHDISGELHQLQQLMEPALELAIEVFEEDYRHELFMSKRFNEMWNYLKSKSPLFRIGTKLNKQHLEVSQSKVSPIVTQLNVKMLITGLNVYGRMVPDLVAYDIVSACLRLGIDSKLPLARDVQNLLWVIKNQS